MVLVLRPTPMRAFCIFHFFLGQDSIIFSNSTYIDPNMHMYVAPFAQQLTRFWKAGQLLVSYFYDTIKAPQPTINLRKWCLVKRYWWRRILNAVVTEKNITDQSVVNVGSTAHHAHVNGWIWVSLTYLEVIIFLFLK